MSELSNILLFLFGFLLLCALFLFFLGWLVENWEKRDQRSRLAEKLQKKEPKLLRCATLPHERDPLYPSEDLELSLAAFGFISRNGTIKEKYYFIRSRSVCRHCKVYWTENRDFNPDSMKDQAFKKAWEKRKK